MEHNSLKELLKLLMHCKPCGQRLTANSIQPISKYWKSAVCRPANKFIFSECTKLYRMQKKVCFIGFPIFRVEILCYSITSDSLWLIWLLVANIMILIGDEIKRYINLCFQRTHHQQTSIERYLSLLAVRHSVSMTSHSSRWVLQSIGFMIQCTSKYFYSWLNSILECCEILYSGHKQSLHCDANKTGTSDLCQLPHLIFDTVNGSAN